MVLYSGIAAWEDLERTHTRYGAAMQYSESVLRQLVAGRYERGGTDGVLFLDGEFKIHGARASGGDTELDGEAG